MTLAAWAAWSSAPAAAADLCASGRRQSPVDIGPTRHAALPALTLATQPLQPRVVDDGHTVRVRLGAGQRLRLGTQVLALQQFHFHVPGGDRIAGESFPMGLHFPAKAADGRLITVVQLFRLGAPHAALGALLPHLPARGQPEHALPVTVDPAQWLAPAAGYYRYDGSLTGAPCTEGVVWLVLKQPLTLSAAQLAQLRQHVSDNAREVQPLNDRVVLEGP